MVFSEVASVSGSQTSEADTQEHEEKARHIGYFSRENLEPRTLASNEALNTAGPLAQRPANDPRTHAESVFGPEPVEQKRDWLRQEAASPSENQRGYQHATAK